MDYTKMDGRKHYSDVNPVQFGHQICESSHSFGPAVRTHWLIHFVVSGRGRFVIDGHEHVLKKDELFIIPPFVETYYEADAEHPWEYVWVGFEGQLPFEPPETVCCPEARSVFEQIKRAGERSNGRTEYLCARIFDLFSVIMERGGHKANHVELAMDLMNTEYMNGLTVNELSERLNLDRTYFSALFSRVVGVPPKKYLTAIRMKQAARFLTEYEYGVAITALSVGFSDVYTFSKTFKKHYGVSPSGFIRDNSAAGKIRNDMTNKSP